MRKSPLTRKASLRKGTAKLAPKCVCGHSKSQHSADSCIRVSVGSVTAYCPCPKYRPKVSLRTTTPMRARKADPARRRFAKQRNKPYTDWVSRLPCFIYTDDCWHPEDLRAKGILSDPTHVNKTRAQGVGDCGEVLNLCRRHHGEQEGRTAEFNAKYGIDCKQEALNLWATYERSVLGRSI